MVWLLKFLKAVCVGCPNWDRLFSNPNLGTIKSGNLFPGNDICPMGADELALGK